MVLGISPGDNLILSEMAGTINHSLSIFASFCENPSLKDLNQLHAQATLLQKAKVPSI